MIRRDVGAIESCRRLVHTADFKVFLAWLEDSLAQEMDVFVNATGEEVFRAQGRVALLKQLISSVVGSAKIAEDKLGSSSL